MTPPDSPTVDPPKETTSGIRSHRVTSLVLGNCGVGMHEQRRGKPDFSTGGQLDGDSELPEHDMAALLVVEFAECLEHRPSSCEVFRVSVVVADNLWAKVDAGRREWKGRMVPGQGVAKLSGERCSNMIVESMHLGVESLPCNWNPR